MTVVPDKITPEIGWRWWFLSPLANRLSSMTKVIKWPTDAAVISELLPSQDPYAGFHAARSYSLLRERFGHLGRPPRTLPYIVGEVSLWGEVIAGDHGYRAEYAFPKSLYVVHELCVCSTREWWTGPEEIAEHLLAYGVPVTVVSTLDDVALERLAA